MTVAEGVSFQTRSTGDEPDFEGGVMASEQRGAAHGAPLSRRRGQLLTSEAEIDLHIK